MIPTAQQQIIYDIISGHRKLRSTESGNISVDAVAGSGKTTTAVQAAKYASKRYKRIAFTAFNKGIAEELGKLGYSVSKAQIRMPKGPIKVVGDSPVSVSLHTDVLAEIQVSVYGESA